MRSICIDMSIGTECEQLVLLNTIKGAAVRYGEEIGREFPFAIALEVTGLRMRIGKLESVSFLLLLNLYYSGSKYK